MLILKVKSGLLYACYTCTKFQYYFFSFGLGASVIIIIIILLLLLLLLLLYLLLLLLLLDNIFVLQIRRKSRLGCYS